ncbi:2-polyprenyl-6-methoxyphenol hydroxylase-like FAD-dependent oxidoreductase [Rhodococcus sp. 27YEA15]|uniref:NAD(P)/FAD-dependent oxidoreductase n=1 Tax=Rhodococcus sp. 27YEA15 TaxID=3156259 RepID=UPI003C7CD25D
MTSTKRTNYDVVIVGASIAGCSTAVMYAQQGLRVALLDASSDPNSHKVLCTHHLQPCGAPVLQRVGATEQLLDLGMVETIPNFWTPWGWVRPGLSSIPPPAGFNVRRETLDPLLRQLADDYPNVELLLSHKVSGLLTAKEGTVGVFGTTKGTPFTVTAKLTVGADGKDSVVAQSARSESATIPNGRFSFFAQLSGLDRDDEAESLSWFLDPDVAYLLPNDGDITVLVLFPTLDKIEPFTTDLRSAFLDYANSLPGGPSIRSEHIVGKIVGTKHFPMTVTDPVGNGFALVGDAAATNDPLWGIGCSWALESAQMLVDATADALHGHGDLTSSLNEYRCARDRMGDHIEYMRGYAGARKFKATERLLISAAAHDPEEAKQFYLFGSRLIPAEEYLSARSLARAVRVHLRRLFRKHTTGRHMAISPT